mgnify:CR=1 FL=1
MEFEISDKFIVFKDKLDTWEEAIKVSAKPLLKNGYINKNYIKSMIDSVNENGPYICIAPNIAMPHARPENGSKKVGFSILRLKEAVSFSDNKDHDSQLLITLSCKESDKHIEILQNIVDILSIDNNINKIINAKSKNEIIKIFKGGNNE